MELMNEGMAWSWGAGTLGGEGNNWAPGAGSILVVGSVRFAPVKSSRRRSDSALAFDSSPEVLTSSQRTPMPLAARRWPRSTRAE